MSQRLLRSYIRTILKEEAVEGGGYSPDMRDGMSTWGTSGAGDIYKIFVSPFTDVLKTTIGKTKEVMRRARTVLRVAFETVVTTFVPFVEDSYDEIFAKEKQDIEKIRGQYKDVYDRTSKALGGDAKVAAFLLAPGAVMAIDAVKAAPAAAAQTLSVLSGGFTDKYFEGGGRRLGRESKVFHKQKLLELKDDDMKEKLQTILKDPQVIAAIEKNTAPLADAIKAAKFEKIDASLKLAQGVLQAKNVGDVKKVLGSAQSKAEQAVAQKLNSMKDVPPEEAKKYQEMMKSESLPQGAFAVLKSTFTKPLEQELKVLKQNKADDDVIKKYEDAIAKIKSF